MERVFVSINEACEALGLGKTSIYQLIKAGKLDVVKFGRRTLIMGTADWVPQVQTFGNLATKLLRTSQGQMETLARMRRGGEQIVRHIHVDNRGGQAVIAENVNTGGPRNGKIDNQSDATGTTSIGPTLLGADAFGRGVPIPSREGQASMQDARRD